MTIIAPDGVVVGESEFDRAQMDNHASRPEVIQARNTGRAAAIRFSDTVEYEMMYVAVPCARSKTQAKLVGFMRLALPLQQVEANLRLLQRTLWRRP